MKTLSLATLLVLAAAAVQAAPIVQTKDLSEDVLKGIATDRQKASIDSYNKAVARAEKNREKAMKEIKKITRENDAGMKKTIQRRQLNTMLPPCERTPESPRSPRDLHIRY
ncbi:MAG: hypothetical protein IKW48_03460 [Akkermansia sp.]|nr:hypothetical protein [Akkermansia sp.]